MGGRMEARRQAMVNFCQFNDPNGCYDDHNVMIEYGTTLEYEWAVRYFLWYANNNLFENEEAEDAEEAEAIVKVIPGLFEDSLKVADELARLQDNRDMLLTYYSKLFNGGVQRLVKELN